MRILIVFATTEGQTRKIADRTAELVRERGHRVELCNGGALSPDLKVDEFDAFVIAASVHQRHHQSTISAFAFAHHELLNSRPSALISVSLSAAIQDQKPEAQGYVDEFVGETGWRPGRILLLGGALRFTEYDFFQEQFVKFVVLKNSRGAVAEQDHEFTDWNALESFMDGFLEAAGQAGTGDGRQAPAP